ncbi:DUF4302 domain-containing protein [Niabella pedocola]|uniref:DUF4302 domain-containing protein n=1 Tax=Niabella pedocola TaxID=1752077 RepID=A0ABS8PUM7_9BACT|nr:DUF4302 domain-containing protein [Niabella pedocola]MCD2424615.1 DUF4302 domain-containing protein [Niabella pedocola]
MNKIVIILLMAAMMAGCRKNEVPLVNGGLPEERIMERLAELRGKLTGAENGWMASLTTTAGGGYGFYMKFGADEKVSMMGDLSEDAATQSQTSTYRVKWVMNAALLFDTYNYITLLQDPDPKVSGGKAGSGLKSDIEFEYIRSSGDSVILQGKKYQNYLYLVKATAAQATDYQQGTVVDRMEAIQDYFEDHFNNYINIDGLPNKISFIVNDDKRLSFQYADAKDSIITIDGKFNFDVSGINFSEGLVVNGIQFKKGALTGSTLKLYDAGGKEYTVSQNPTPVIPLKLLFAYNKTYNTILIGSATLPAGVTSGFNSVFNGMVSRFVASSRSIDSVRIVFSNSTQGLLEIRYKSGTTAFQAALSFSYVLKDGVLTLADYAPVLNGTSSNWTSRIDQIGSFDQWIRSGPFKIDWVASAGSGGKILGGLYKVSDPSDFYYGDLRKR